MLVKCVQCTYGRSIARQFSPLSICRTDLAYFCTKKDGNSNYGKIRERFVPPKRKTIFQAIKDHRENHMMIDKVPEKESIGSVLKVQRANLSIPKDFKTVYQFPAVKYFALVNRLKVYQTAFTVVGSVGSTVFSTSGIVSANFAFITTLIGISGCLMFYSLGYAAARFVGFIYYNEKTEMVRIAYVDFWGRRRDIEVPVSDIVPSNEAPVGLINKVWYPLRRYSTKETLKLQLEQGIILDPKAMKKIF